MRWCAGVWELSGLQGDSLHSAPPDGGTGGAAAHAAAASAGGAWDLFMRPRLASAALSRGLPAPAMLLLLARVCAFLEGPALSHVMEALAAAFPGQGGSAGSAQPPAFVAGEVARWGTLHSQKRRLIMRQLRAGQGLCGRVGIS
jgi:hypothetical protein